MSGHCPSVIPSSPPAISYKPPSTACVTTDNNNGQPLEGGQLFSFLRPVIISRHFVWDVYYWNAITAVVMMQLSSPSLVGEDRSVTPTFDAWALMTGVSPRDWGEPSWLGWTLMTVVSRHAARLFSRKGAARLQRSVGVYYFQCGVGRATCFEDNAWYSKRYHRLSKVNHTLAFDWCHFWRHWRTFKGHFSLGCHFHAHYLRNYTRYVHSYWNYL